MTAKQAKVRFSFPEIILYEQNQIQQKEKDAIWYQKHELSEIRRKSLSDIKRLKSIIIEENQQQPKPSLISNMYKIHNDNNICGRGLEFFVSNERRQRSRRAIKSVLKVQDKIRKNDFSFISEKNQNKYEMNSDKIISKILRHLTHSARDLSIMVGKKDALDAKVIHRENKENINNCATPTTTMIIPAIPRQISFFDSNEGGLSLSSSKKRMREICATKPFVELSIAGGATVRQVSIDKNDESNYHQHHKYEEKCDVQSSKRRCDNGRNLVHIIPTDTDVKDIQ